MAIGLQVLSSNQVLTNNTTPVTAVAAPSAGVARSVRTVYVYNADTVAATVSINVVVSGTAYTLLKAAIAPGSTLEFGDESEFVILDATTKSIQVVLAGSITTNQLQVNASWGDYQ